MRFNSVPLVFCTDDDRPLRKLVNVALSPGYLSLSLGSDFGGKTVEHTFAFQLCCLPSVLLLARSWFAVTLGRPAPIRRTDLVLRNRPPKRQRLTITPPWPLDYVIHLYGTPSVDVGMVMETFVNDRWVAASNSMC